ncbi:hypothetical protein [Endozoicomonas arenosclerae]|uniref:hypothetical protein n=1 Tax=Endozoicomonas arenosclerae TaxID=1633495 RepID=UPI0015609F9B|nr:hypothetical protein [Endozoicomonas arenosclerae]
MQLMQRRVAQLNDQYHLTVQENTQPQPQSIDTAKEYLHSFQDLMASQAGQMLLMESTLESLLQTLSQPEGNADVADELQHCLTRYMSASRTLNEEPTDSLIKMQALLYNWIDEHKDLAGPVSEQQALEQINTEVETLFENFSQAMDMHQSIVTRSLTAQSHEARNLESPRTVPAPIQTTGRAASEATAHQSEVGTKEQYLVELGAVIRGSEGMITSMNIPDQYPNARTMLLDDLKTAGEVLNEEARSREMTPSELKSWYTDNRKRLLKMQETMYLAVRSPDKKPPSYPARRGLYNRYRDCPFNSHSQALAHSGWSDYFLHRFLPSVPSPGPRPVLDPSKLENLDTAIAQNKRQTTEMTERLASVEAQIRPYDETIEAINAQMRALPKPAELRYLTAVEKQKSLKQRFALADQKREPMEKRALLTQEKTSLENELTRLHEESLSLSMEQRTTQQKFERDRQEQLGTWERANNKFQNFLRKQALQTSWLKILEELRDTSKSNATTLQPAYDRQEQIQSMDGQFDGIVPPEYSLKETLLDPRDEASRRRFHENECGLYKWGGHDHWTFLIVNEQGEVDRINDSQCTRRKFASKQAMLDYFSQPGLYVREQLTAVHP